MWNAARITKAIQSLLLATVLTGCGTQPIASSTFPSEITLPAPAPDPVGDAPTDEYTPGPTEPNRTSMRVVTYNTACIIPEMDASLMVHLDTIMEGDLPCIGAITEFIKDAANLLTLGIEVDPLDFRNTIEDRVMDRAQRICDAILEHSDVDVIALNEVFYEPARDRFVSELAGTFPHYVRKLSGGTVCTEDSGLMLFSRWPFASLPAGIDPADGVEAHSGGLSFSHVGFVEFDDCNCEDCLAEKGAGYVRIQNPHTGELHHVVFTHMQADPTACYLNATSITEVYATRDAQLTDIRNLIDDALGTKGYAGDTHVVVLGDINVVGTQADAAAETAISPDNIEWYMKFVPTAPGLPYFAGDPLGAYAGRPLYDSWAMTTSPHDPGVTNGESNRLDYIFLNAAPYSIERRLVPHHLTLRFDHTYSDHLAVHAVLNDWQPHCMPADALKPQEAYAPGAWPNDEAYLQGITAPGGYQWFRFDLPGTYSFAITSPNGENEKSGFDLRVYLHTDLTFDISNYYGETTDLSEYFQPAPGIVALPEVSVTGKVYLVPEAPFYVRISPQAEDGTGTYVLYVHRHEGRSKKDAVRLPANCTQDYFHGTAPLNADDMPWFQVNLETADSGLSQSLRFYTIWEPAMGAGPLNLLLQDEADTLLGQSNSVLTTDGDPQDNGPAYDLTGMRHYVEIEATNLEVLGTRFFLRVQRPGLPAGSAYDQYHMRWETDLTVLHGYTAATTHPLELYCEDETCGDWSGSDEVSVDVYVDGTFLVHLSKNQIGGEATDMDTGDNASLEGLIPPLRFVQSAKIKVIETDDGDPDIGDINIGVLGPRDSTAWKRSKSTSVNCSGIGSDGEYKFRYNLSRSLEYVCH